MAGGVPFEARRNGTRIIRTVGGTRQEVKVNLTRVIKGLDPDPLIQPDDIIFVPTDAMKAALRAGGIGTILTLLYATQYAP
jgi:polysaccharide export outer membrane protein